MGNLLFAQDSDRLGLYLPLGQTKKNPSIVVPFHKIGRSELDEIVRAALAEQGITNESEVQAICDEAEEQYEERRKVEEARVELRRLMGIKRQGGKLMQVGDKKWKQAFYPTGGRR